MIRVVLTDGLTGAVEWSGALREYLDANREDAEAVASVRESLRTGRPVLCGFSRVAATRAADRSAA